MKTITPLCGVSAVFHVRSVPEQSYSWIHSSLIVWEVELRIGGGGGGTYPPENL